MPSLIEILGRKILKFGETLAARAVGNPELSLEWPGKCRDLTGIKSERYLEDKVHTFAKALDKLNWWHIGGWINRIRCSKKRNGQLSLFRIDMNGAVNA